MVFLQQVGLRILEILLVPYFKKSVIWTIAPLIFALLMMQMYFGKYKTEQLGWNTAFNNSISLMWVTAILLKYVYEKYGLLNALKHYELTGYFILIIALVLFTLVLTVLNFNHLIPKKFAFILSSPLSVNILAYFIIVIIMGKINLDIITFWASAVIFVFILAIFSIYRKSITPPKTIIKTLEKHEKQRRKELKRFKRKLKKLKEKLISVLVYKEKRGKKKG